MSRHLCPGPAVTERGDASASSERQPEPGAATREAGASGALRPGAGPVGLRGVRPPLPPGRREGQALGGVEPAKATQVCCCRCFGCSLHFELACLLANSATVTSCQHMAPVTESLARDPSGHESGLPRPTAEPSPRSWAAPPSWPPRPSASCL